ncbi:hypothetical protein ACRALDRAFT_207841 [Sodiomyces alcalophilus JCM 7366]|uniref:uncharacterized protein n=1 Tax=Sodiomyces alcalophilus JCM 7366 TaxID=591952 RepID=UPI0039B6DBB6
MKAGREVSSGRGSSRTGKVEDEGFWREPILRVYLDCKGWMCEAGDLRGWVDVTLVIRTACLWVDEEMMRRLMLTRCADIHRGRNGFRPHVTVERGPRVETFADSLSLKTPFRPNPPQSPRDKHVIHSGSRGRGLSIEMLLMTGDIIMDTTTSAYSTAKASPTSPTKSSTRSILRCKDGGDMRVGGEAVVRVYVWRPEAFRPLGTPVSRSLYMYEVHVILPKA